jgi:DNA-binding XRE family transcriptional regulator
MDAKKAKQLKEAGWQVGNASDFLDLSPEEAELVEFKLALAARVKELRLSQGLTQVQLAKAIGSSQSRIAKLEAADSSVSTDFMLRSFFKLGARNRDIRKLISPRRQRPKETA